MIALVKTFLTLPASIMHYMPPPNCCFPFQQNSRDFRIAKSQIYARFATFANFIHFPSDCCTALHNWPMINTSFHVIILFEFCTEHLASIHYPKQASTLIIPLQLPGFSCCQHGIFVRSCFTDAVVDNSLLFFVSFQRCAELRLYDSAPEKRNPWQEPRLLAVLTWPLRPP